MSPAEGSKRIVHLRLQVESHDERYYRRAAPEISDLSTTS